MKASKNKKSFTLIELLVVIAILGLVASIAFSMFSFSNRVFKNSNINYDVQNDIRLAASYLSKEVRFATHLDIISVAECEAELASHEYFDYFYIKNGSLHQAVYSGSAHNIKTISQYIASTHSSFAKSAKNVLKILLDSEEQGKNYGIETDIVLENFPLISSTTEITGSNNLAIRYKTQQPHQALIPATSISITGPSTITALYGEIDLDAVIHPDDASIKSVLWSVDEPLIAAIDSAGVLRAGNNGTVLVTATAADGSGVHATHTVVITGQTVPSSSTSATSSTTTTPTTTPTTSGTAPTPAPTPQPTPIPAPQFPVAIVGGSNNTPGSFSVNFGNEQVKNIELLENKPGMIITFSSTRTSNEKSATLTINGTIIDQDWIIVKFTEKKNMIAIIRFYWDQAEVAWKIG